MAQLSKDERTKAFSIRLTESEFEAIACFAEEVGLPVANYIRMTLKDHIRKTEQDRGQYR